MNEPDKNAEGSAKLIDIYYFAGYNALNCRVR